MASGDWWYNSDSGAINQQSLPDWIGGSLETHLGLGWHGPFHSKQEAINWYNNNKANNPGWKAPTDSIGQQLLNTAPPPISNVVQGATWLSNNIETLIIRVSEVLIGLVLMGIGLASITGAGNFVSKAVRATV